MPEGRSARLRRETASVREACRAHPFVRGIGDGTLAPEVFARWVEQDWRYLLTYVDVLESLSRSASTREASTRWRELAAFTRREELSLHRAYAARFGLTEAALDGAEDAPATRDYTGFLRDAVERSHGHGVAAIVPCGVGYVAIGADLAAAPLPADARYRDWIRTYADPAFAEAVAWMEEELDAAPDGDGAISRTYRGGAEHELAFWEQLWRGW